jgi:hypothetical protein
LFEFYTDRRSSAKYWGFHLFPRFLAVLAVLAESFVFNLTNSCRDEFEKGPIMRRFHFTRWLAAGACVGMALSIPRANLSIRADQAALAQFDDLSDRTPCLEALATTGVSGCRSLPTSLACLNISTPDGRGFSGEEGSHCGWKKFLFIIIPCGPPLGDEACI